MSNSYVFTSESVSEGHPDKVADQISDGILDALLRGDRKSRVACETMVKNDMVILGGEITSQVRIDYEQVAREVIREIGYTEAALGFSADSCEVIQYITTQSPDISQGVNNALEDSTEQGAGDQGLMFGFACDETPELMPLPIALAHQLAFEMARLRKAGEADFLKPDAKSQVSILYENGAPKRAQTIVISTQHDADTPLEQIQEFVIERVIKKIVPAKLLANTTRFFINPTGRFVVGGPVGDCGLTGRKIIVDTYGGYSRHGGGAFSGKDPSKVDRSAAYAARYIAKNLVGAGVARKCEVQLAYAIGVAEPVSIYVDTFGTSKVGDADISAAVRDIFSLTPRGIIQSLDLLNPIYRRTAAYGHFGRNPSHDGHFSWEKLDKVEQLRDRLPKALLAPHAPLRETARATCL